MCLGSLSTYNIVADTKLLENLPPDSAEQQSLIADTLNSDGYNWG